jgi:hypothetical protein
MAILTTQYLIIINQLHLALHSHQSMARFHHIINMGLLDPGYSFLYGHIFLIHPFQTVIPLQFFIFILNFYYYIF